VPSGSVKNLAPTELFINFILLNPIAMKKVLALFAALSSFFIGSAQDPMFLKTAYQL
jgi:hypothetical protein